MPKRDYVEKNALKFAAQLQHFKATIGGYATLFGLMAEQLAAQAADADYFSYQVTTQEITADTAQELTAWRDISRFGGAPTAAGAPLTPTWPAPVAAVVPGIEARFRALVQWLKVNPNYNAGIGQALGIEGAQHTAPELTTIQPVIGLKLDGGRVEVDWGLGGNSQFLDMIELRVDRGDVHGSVLLTHDTTPGYIDTAPFPATPIAWTYTGIYIVHDARVRQPSNPVNITVGG
jgi:hypothetical protein